jgi:hypothetical protein
MDLILVLQNATFYSRANGNLGSVHFHLTICLRFTVAKLPVSKQICIVSSDVDKTPPLCLTLLWFRKQITRNMQVILSSSNSLFSSTVVVTEDDIKNVVVLQNSSYFAQWGWVALK